MKVFIIEGNIAAGKSTLAQKLNHSQKFQVLPEPLEQWQNLEGVNLLGFLGKDFHQWTFAFQVYVLTTMAQRAQVRRWPIICVAFSGFFH